MKTKYIIQYKNVKNLEKKLFQVITLYIGRKHF